MQQRFKQLREHYNLSQAQFAQKIHRGPGFISNIETGRRTISKRTLDAICAAFPINREWLINGTGDMFIGFKEGCEPKPVDKSEVANRIKKVRKNAGLTQEEFAKRIGYSKGQIHSVETNMVVPSNQFLEKVIDEFSLNADWMFTGNGPMMSQGKGLDNDLIHWLEEHPEIVRELRRQAGRY